MQQLEAILADSAASMQGTAGATSGNGSEGGSSVSTSSKGQKAAWWRARLGLDDRLRALLEGLDSRCLGPWLCAFCLTVCTSWLGQRGATLMSRWHAAGAC